MKNLYDPALAAELKTRIRRLRPDSPREWGTMTAPQAMAHCAIAMAWAVGETKPPRMFVGRLLGGLVKSRVMNNDEPLKRNTPTAKELVISDARELETERTRLIQLIDQFTGAGPSRCTTHPHPFFGSLTPTQWATLMYKHVDHHLRQFGA